MRISLIIAVAVLALEVIASAQGSSAPRPDAPPAGGDTWAEYSFEEVGLRATFPTKPQIDVIPLPADLAKFNPRSVASRGSRTVCVVLRYDIPTLEGAAQGAFLDLMTKDFIAAQVASQGLEVRDVETAILGDRAAKGFVLALPAKKFEMQGRLTVCGSHCYVAMAGGSLPLDTAEVREFLASVKFSDCGTQRKDDRDRVSRTQLTVAAERAQPMSLISSTAVARAR